MKKVLSLCTEGSFWIFEWNKVYGIYDRESNRRTYYDFNGNCLKDYVRSREAKKDADEYIAYDIDDGRLYYNKYGVAEGRGSLVDIEGEEIPDTKFNLVDDCNPNNRYYMFCFLTEEQERLVDQCGTAPNIMMDVYDTKERRYVVRGIPECVLYISGYHGDPKLVRAAADMIYEYDTIWISESGAIECKKKKDSLTQIDVFDYYQDE